MCSSPSSTNREHLLVMSGGAPLDEVDGYSVTLVDHDNTMTLQLTSNVRGMHVLEDTQADRDSGIVGPDADNSTTGRSCLTTFKFWRFALVGLSICLSVCLSIQPIRELHLMPIQEVAALKLMFVIFNVLFLVVLGVSSVVYLHLRLFVIS